MAYEVGLANHRPSSDYGRLYNRVVESIDPWLVLEHYEARNVYEERGELVHSCLIDQVHPHHTHGDEKPSAALNVETKLYSCYSYGGGDIVWLIMEMEDISRQAALQFLAKFLSDDQDDFAHSMLDLVRARFAKGENTPAKMPSYSDIILYPWRKIHPYMADRGITDEVVVRYRIGYDDAEQKITIPHFWNGKLVGYQKRRLEYPYADPDVTIPKYKNSPDFPKETTLYNWDPVCSRGLKDVVVVESVLSVLKAESLGMTNVLATFGGKVTLAQADCLREFASVTLFFDNDLSGWSGTTKLYKWLKSDCRVRIIDGPVGRDMADFENREELDGVLAQATTGALVINRISSRMEKYKHDNEAIRASGRGTGR